MKPLEAAIKRATGGERIRWQAEPKIKRSLGSLVMKLAGSHEPTLARPVYVLTDSRLVALEQRGEAFHVREVQADTARDLLARWTSLTEAERTTADVRLLQEIELLCPTGSVNTLKRTLERAQR